jgi:hypothetical protein
MIDSVEMFARRPKLPLVKTMEELAKEDAINKAIETAMEDVTKPDLVDLRNQDHADLWNSALRIMKRRGREFFLPDDMSLMYSMVSIADRIAGSKPMPLHSAFFGELKTPAEIKIIEAATHDKPVKKEEGEA